MKRFFLIFLAFTVSLSVFSVLLPVTNASAYGASLPTTDILMLESSDGSKVMDVSEDSLTPWYDVLDTAILGWDYNHRPSDCHQGVRDSLVSFRNTGRIAISLVHNNGLTELDSNRAVIIYANEYESSNFMRVAYSTENDSHLYAPDGDKWSAILQLKDDGNLYLSCGYSYKNMNWQGPWFAGSEPGFGILGQVYYVTYDLQYDPAFNGTNPPLPTAPGTGNNNNEKVKHYPQVGYTVNDERNFKGLFLGGNDYQIPTNLDGFLTPKLRWTISLDDEIVKTEVLDLGTPFNHHFPSNDDYVLKVEFIHPGPPWADFSDDVELIPTTINLPINGFFISGSTFLNDCDLSSGSFECEEASPFEDCAYYNTTLIINEAEFEIPSAGTFTCIFNNFGIWLRNTIVDLFVPSTAKMQASFNRFADSLQSQFGFLYTSFDMFVDWLQSLLTVNPDCTPDLGNAEFFGSKLEVNFCSFEQNAPNIYNILMGTLRLLVAGFFVFIGFRRLMDIVKGLGR